MNPAPDATSPDAPLPERWRGWLAATVAAFLLLLLLLRPVNYSDSFNYAKHIVDQQRHWAVADSPFYDFGHLLWRPLGWLAWAPLQAPLRAAFHGDDILAAGAVLIALSMAGGLLGVVLLFLWIARSTRSAPVAATASIGFACTNALLYYTPTGMAYAAGLACQTGAFAWLQYALGRGRFTLARGALAGLLLGLSIAIWFPFALTAGGVVVYAAISESAPAQRGWRTRAAGIAGLIGATAALLAVTYGAAILMLHYTSIEALSAWIARSRYGKSPDRGLLRMLGGIPRGFLSLGEGSVEWKRVLFAGQKVSVLALLRSGIWKVALVYGVLASSVVALARSPRGPRLLAVLAAIAVPLVIFAAFLFEADPPERYLAVFPVLFLAFAEILAARRAGTFSKLLLAGFFVAMLAVNGGAMWRFRDDANLRSARTRLVAVNRVVQPPDRILLLSYKDRAEVLLSELPFDDTSRNRYLFTIGLPWGGNTRNWRANFAALAEATWQAGGRLWLSRRFLASHPQPDWDWVEGDLPGIPWRDLPALFTQLDLGETVGEPDGFSEVPPTGRNRALLDSLLGNSPR